MRNVIRGEYWIDANGNVTYADGDTGDSNHEMIAREHLLSLVIDRLQEVLDLSKFPEKLREDAHMLNEAMYEIREEEFAAWLETDEKEVLMLNACKRSEAREYVIRHMQWIHVSGTNCELHRVDQGVLLNLKRGYSEILSQEGYDDEIPEVDITIYSTINGQIEMTLAQLEEEDFSMIPSALLVTFSGAVTRNALQACDALDRAAMPPCYTSLGD